IPARHYQDSCPTAGPESISPWRLLRCTLASICLSVAFFFRTGATTSLPSATDRSTMVPSCTSVSSAKGLGILRARLLPHFCTCTRINVPPRVSTKKVRHVGTQGQGNLLVASKALFFLSFHATKQLMLPTLFTPQFLARLETLRIRARRQFLGSRPGGHLSPRRGTGLEFADYRHYTPGDDPRYIDWKLYSRTDRLYIKLFQEEEELYTYLFLDLSASMAYPVGNDKYGAARDLALALAYVVLASEDAVKLHALGSGTNDPATPV